MSPTQISTVHRTLRTYAQFGAMGGLGLGAIAGIVASGPHFHEWEASQSLTVIAVAAATGAGVGWMAIRLVVGSLLGGAVESSGDEPSGASGEIGAHSGRDGGHGD